MYEERKKQLFEEYSVKFPNAEIDVNVFGDDPDLDWQIKVTYRTKEFPFISSIRYIQKITL